MQHSMQGRSERGLGGLVRPPRNVRKLPKKGKKMAKSIVLSLWSPPPEMKVVPPPNEISGYAPDSMLIILVLTMAFRTFYVSYMVFTWSSRY